MVMVAVVKNTGSLVMVTVTVHRIAIITIIIMQEVQHQQQRDTAPSHQTEEEEGVIIKSDPENKLPTHQVCHLQKSLHHHLEEEGDAHQPHR
jgi:hypothetical protein